MSEQTTFELGTLKPEPNGIPKFGFRTSPDITAIAEAMVSAQAEFGAAIKDSANPAYRSKYADLSACIEATQKALNKYGIAVMQAPQLDGQMVTITTRLQHKSGQWYESDLTLPAVQRDRFDSQSVGSAITYGRRYSLQAILNLATTDDDGNAASGIGSHEAAQAIGKEKVEKLKAAVNGERSLFFLWDDTNQIAEITGDDALKKLCKDILRPLWSQAAKAIIANAEQLENLKFQLESRGVPFRQLKAARS